MGWKDVRIATKLTVGFGSLLGFMLVLSLVGFDGIRQMGQALMVVAEEEAPLVNAASAMQLTMWKARDIMEEYKSATAVMATYDKGSLDGYVAAFDKVIQEFDRYQESILKGGQAEDGSSIVATDNPELAQLVKEADRIHNDKFQVAAKRVLSLGQGMVQQKEHEDQAMSDMEVFFDQMQGKVATTEQIHAQELNHLSSNLDKAAQMMVKEEMPLADAINELKNALSMTRIKLEEVAQTNEVATLATFEREFGERMQIFDQLVNIILKGGELDGKQVIATDNMNLRAAIEEIDRMHDEFRKKSEALIHARRTTMSQAELTKNTLGEMDRFGEETEGVLQRVKKLSEGEMEAARKNGVMTQSRATGIMFAASAVALIVGIFLGVVITRGITQPLSELSRTVMAVEKNGDFTQHANIKQNDEVGQTVAAFNSLLSSVHLAIEEVNVVMLSAAKGEFSKRVQSNVQGELKVLKENVNLSTDNIEHAISSINHVMERVAEGNLSERIRIELKGDLGLLKDRINQSLASLSDTLSQVSQSIRQVASAAGQTSNAVGQIADGSQNQMHATGQVAAAVGQAYNAIAEVTRDVEEASRLSRQTADLVHTGQNRMSQMVNVVNDIAQSSEKVSKITEVIAKIANQTNLLSLNAAIEAARAGEHGKGFAVVAEEVRKLAENAEIQTGEITELVRQAVKQAERAVESANNVSVEMNSITSAAADTDKTLARVVASMEQQSAAVEEIKSNMGSLRTIGDTNAAASEEITATVVDLSKLADNTRQVVERFKV